ncbi:late embryogenesis abundant protein 6-like [Benincasa hispida]|uniref:late embryogenesis abundant protein 6-like n=1 Tax=Benincasa hispida TaxID=102211 RepID=UPI0018FFAC18|nr:late embryogenesis abundant protein 6-like [Benincasa hispida]
MQSAMEKLSNMGSVAKEKLKICRAKLDEKVEKASVKTREERKIAEERRKAATAEAKRELHEAKARHAAQKLRSKKSHVLGGHLHHHPPMEGAAATNLGAANVPAAYPIPTTEGYYPGHKI